MLDIFDSQGRPDLVADNHQARNDPIVNLWISVIIRAIHDTVGYNMSANGKELRRAYKETAEYFLFEDPESLEAVCAAINLDPAWVRKIAKERRGHDPVFHPRASARVERRHFVGGTKAKLFRKTRKEAGL